MNSEKRKAPLRGLSLNLLSSSRARDNVVGDEPINVERILAHPAAGGVPSKAHKRSVRTAAVDRWRGPSVRRVQPGANAPGVPQNSSPLDDGNCTLLQTGYGLETCNKTGKPPSTSGLGRGPFKAEALGSNPTGGTR